MVSSEIIERAATNEINQIIGLDHRLSSFVNVGDREPVLDGFIYGYKDNTNHSVKNLDFRVPVQVKGQTNSISKSGAKYSVKKEWLEFYAENHGTLFIVVFLNREATAVIGTYYASFTPAEAKLVLKRMGNKQSKSVHLNRLNKTYLYSVLKKFHGETDIFNKNVEIVDADTVSQLSNPAIALPVGIDPRDLNMEQIVFTGIRDGIRVLVDMSGTQDIEFSPMEKTIVTFPNGAVYEGWLVSKQENFTLHVNENIKLLFEQMENEVNVKMNWNFPFQDINSDEAARKRCDDMETLASLIDGKGLHVKNSRIDAQVPMNLDESAIDSLHDLKNEAEMLRNLFDINLIMNTNFINMKLDKESMRQLQFVISLLNPTPEQIKTVDPLLRIVINGKKYFLTFFNGVLKSMFSEDSDIQFGKVGLSDEPNGVIFESGNALLMIDDTDYVNMPQYNLNVVLKNNVVPLDDNTPKWYVTKFENIMLSYIDVFDITGDVKWLDAASEFVDMMQFTNQIDARRAALNSAQIQLRKGEGITPQTVKIIVDILEYSNDNYLKVGATILMRDDQHFKELIRRLKKDERDSLLHFPISKMMTDSMKNILSDLNE